MITTITKIKNGYRIATPKLGVLEYTSEKEALKCLFRQGYEAIQKRDYNG